MTQQLESSIPAEQQEQNCDDAVNILLDAINNSGTEPSTNTDASAMSIDSLADAITRLFDTILEQLIALRDERYSAAIEELDDEASTLAREYEQLEKDIKAIEATLPSRERLVQRQVDELVVNGDPAAKQKFAELAEFKRKPAVMRQRLGVIHDRFQSIASEKSNVAREVFASWYSECQLAIRAGEHGLFVTLLSGIEASMYEFQTRTGTERSGLTGGLFHQGHIIGLTADEKSAEWKAARHWYGT